MCVIRKLARSLLFPNALTDCRPVGICVHLDRPSGEKVGLPVTSHSPSGEEGGLPGNQPLSAWQK